jgi:hypothetical protein
MNPSEDHPWVKPTSLEAWENSPHKSVKLDVLGRLVSYHLMQNGRPPMEMDESGRTLTANPMFEASGLIADDAHPDRIVIYSAFPSSNRAIFDVSPWIAMSLTTDRNMARSWISIMFLQWNSMARLP